MTAPTLSSSRGEDIGFGSLQQAFAGNYETSPGVIGTVAQSGDHLTLAWGEVKWDLYAEAPTEFFTVERDVRVTFYRNSRGEVTHLVWIAGGRTVRATRLP